MRVVRCSEIHRGELVHFFEADPYYALFFLGNIQTMGLAHPDLDYWAMYDEQETLVAVLLRYVSNFSILASDEQLDLMPLITIIDEHEQVLRLTGKVWIVNEILAKLERHSLPVQNDDYFCSLKAEDFQPGSTEGVRLAVLEDQERIHRFYEGGEFSHFTGATFRRRLVDGQCRIFVMEVDGEIVSSAGSSAETTVSAMIGAVYTPEALRGRGYASRVMSALCASLLEDGKEPCLFYDNPSAGVIYRRLGYQDIGMFKMAAVEE